MPGDPLRNAAEQNATQAVAAMAANHDQIGRPSAGGSHDRLYGVADGDEFCRIIRNRHAIAKARQNLRDPVIRRQG